MRRNEQTNDLIEKVERSALREAALRAELKETECRCADLETKVRFPRILAPLGRSKSWHEITRIKQITRRDNAATYFN